MLIYLAIYLPLQLVNNKACMPRLPWDGNTTQSWVGRNSTNHCVSIDGSESADEQLDVYVGWSPAVRDVRRRLFQMTQKLTRGYLRTDERDRFEMNVLHVASHRTAVRRSRSTADSRKYWSLMEKEKEKATKKEALHSTVDSLFGHKPPGDGPRSSPRSESKGNCNE